MTRPSAPADLEAHILAAARRQRSTLDDLAARLDVTVPRLLADLRRGTIGEVQLRTIMAALGVPPDDQDGFMRTALARRSVQRVMMRVGKVEAEMRSLRSAVNGLVGRVQGSR